MLLYAAYIQLLVGLMQDLKTFKKFSLGAESQGLSLGAPLAASHTVSSPLRRFLEAGPAAGRGSEQPVATAPCTTTPPVYSALI